MREILSRRLWLGNSSDLRRPDIILEAGIQAVVDLAVEQPMPMLPRTMIYSRFPVFDGLQESASALRAAIETLVRLIRSRIPTLVCCGAGMSRSPAITAAALSIVDGGEPDARLREIAVGHPHDVSPQLWYDVRQACSEILGNP